MSLDELVAIFQRELHLPDPYPLIIVAATYASNRLSGDAVWTMVVGPPSSGKTEILGGLVGLPEVFDLSKITVAGLLTTRSAAFGGGHGGLLAEIVATGHNRDGIILCKDFTSVLSVPSESRAEVLAALREIYDGSWSRRLGTNGGTSLAWNGRLTFIGAVTEAIDGHGDDMAAMGHRFILCRMPVLDGPDRRALGGRALAKSGTEQAMRRRLGRAFQEFSRSIPTMARSTTIGVSSGERLVALADFASRCRSSVGRGGHRREVEYLSQPEAPARVVTQLGQLYRAFRLLELSPEESLGYVGRVARDMVPPDRLLVIDLLAAKNRPLSVAYVSGFVGLPQVTVQRVLEDLTLLGVAERTEPWLGLWSASGWLRSYAGVFGPLSAGRN
jgi:hypothetical protein